MEQPSELKATKDMCAFCFDAILHYLDKRERLAAPSSIPKTPAPLFVTWHINGDDLRGCIGNTLYSLKILQLVLF